MRTPIRNSVRRRIRRGATLIGEFEVSAPESQAAPGPVLSAAVLEQESERHAPRVAVDPTMMAEPAAGSSGMSFSDLAEMPPLKEPVFAPPVPEPAEPSRPVAQIYPQKKEEKPKIQPREVAEKAIQQIVDRSAAADDLFNPGRGWTDSRDCDCGLFSCSLGRRWFHGRSAAGESRKASPARDAQTPVAPRIETQAPPVAPIADAQPNLTVRQVEKRNSNSTRRAPAPAPVPVVIPGEALIDSSPQGAQFQVDGKSDPSWVTPFNVPGLSPGKHIISVSKSGYSSEIRSVDVAAGSNSSLLLHLAPVNALVVVNSTPPGAEVIIDGKPTGRVTPVQFAVEKGSHTVLVRKQGYLDETVTADLGPAQNFQYSPVLRALGNADDIRTVGKLNKLFGRGGDSDGGHGFHQRSNQAERRAGRHQPAGSR